MAELKVSSPEVYLKFEDGSFTILRRSDRYWAGIPSDQIIEQMLMRALKTRGGLSRGRGFTEVQQAVWLYSRNVCAAVNLSLKNDFLGMDHCSSEQQVIIGKEYSKKNKADFINTLEFFSSRKVFDVSRNCLENIVTGVEAADTVNVHCAKDVGNKIIGKADGCSVKSYKLKRADQAITMGTKIKRQDGTMQEVDPQELFDRLINLAFVCSSCQSGDNSRLQLKYILCFELSPFPAPLFESELLWQISHRLRMH